MTAVMVCLVGEQPMPNLLAARHLHPGRVVLAFTDKVSQHCARLEAVLKTAHVVFSIPVTAYDILATGRQLAEFLVHPEWPRSEVVFNVSGGTTAMSFAAYRLAERWRCRFVYVETSEGAESELHQHAFAPDGTLQFESSAELPPLITIDDYLKAHLGAYASGGYGAPPGGDFEREIEAAVGPVVDEVISNVRHPAIDQVDLVFRLGNQVGVAEVKTGKITKDCIEQHNLACRRETLGTYTRKLLVVGSSDPTRTNLLELTRTSGIAVVDLPSYGGPGSLSADDRQRIARQVLQALRALRV